MCDGVNHKLMNILEIPEACPGESTVVRWCMDCGAVVVDVDYDGRTIPGGVMKMKTPKSYHLIVKAREVLEKK